MVPDPAWDNAPQPRKGLSLFGKVAIGCGGAMLCFLLAIGALAWLVFSKASKALDHGWLQVHVDIQNLRTEEGARALYRKNPGLAQAFPTEAEFLKAAAGWRAKLGDIPEHRPPIKELMGGQGAGALSIQSREGDGRKTMTVRIRMSTGANLVVELENDKLVDIQVD